MSGATDAARAAADLVLTEPGLSVIIRAVEEARRIFERMNSYAIYRITETIRIMIFIVLAIVVYNVYPITAIMIILLALLNDLPIMTIAYDNTWLDPKPVRWQMHRVLRLATVLGTVGVAETFLLLVIAKSYFGIGLAQLQSLIFLKLVMAGHLTLFVARTRKPFFRRAIPGMAAARGYSDHTGDRCTDSRVRVVRNSHPLELDWLRVAVLHRVDVHRGQSQITRLSPFRSDRSPAQTNFLN